MSKPGTKRRVPFTVIGIVLLAAALALAGYNLWRDAAAGASSEAALEELLPALPQDTASADPIPGETNAGEQEIPDYQLDPDMAMPTKTADGQAYIGVLSIPKLGKTLPILSEWDAAKLNIAPCRYAGSAYQNNLVIAGHNYRRHFGRLGTLSPGDTILFTDMDGNRFTYQVVELETLQPYAIEDMKTGDWDLTLFTCTLGGQTRMTVRCELVS